MLTVLILVEAYSKPKLLKKESVSRKNEYSVWIVPGGTEGDGDIDALLDRDGIQVLERVSKEQAERCAEEIRLKFKNAGLEMKKELLCND